MANKYRVTRPLLYPVGSPGYRDTRARNGEYIEALAGVDRAKNAAVVACDGRDTATVVDVEDLTNGGPVRRFYVYDGHPRELSADDLIGVGVEEDR